MESSLSDHRCRDSDTRHECEGEYEGYLFLCCDTIARDIELHIFDFDTLFLFFWDEAIDEIKSIYIIIILNIVESTMSIFISLISIIA